MQIKITNGDNFILIAWTDMWKGPDIPIGDSHFTQKTLTIRIENNHLFIVDNNWNSIAIKPYSYNGDCLKSKRKDLAILRDQAIKSKAKKVDGICIDLSDNSECKSIQKRRKEVTATRSECST